MKELSLIAIIYGLIILLGVSILAAKIALIVYVAKWAWSVF